MLFWQAHNIDPIKEQMILGCGVSTKDWLEFSGISNLLKAGGWKKGVVRISSREEVKHSNLGTSVTRRMMPLRELQEGPHMGRTGKNLIAQSWSTSTKGYWGWICTVTLAS